jgi:hypothetical protein
MAIRAKKRKASPAKKAPARRSSVRKVATTAKRRITRRYKPAGKVDIKHLAMDAAATIAGAVAAGIAGQTLTKQGVDSRIAGVAPVAVGALLALKGKKPMLKAIGIGMIAAAGLSVVNNATKAAGILSGDNYGDDSILDSMDVYSNPDLLGVPVEMQSPALLGIPMDIQPSELSGEWNTGVQVG